jgi:hypothetical protein
MKSAALIIAVVSSLVIALPSSALTPAPQPPRPRTMVALVFGQSNAGNWGETARISGPRVFAFFRGRFGRARDPLPGANGEGGSVWTRLGDKLIAAKLYDRVIFVPASIGATDIALWAPDGLLHKDLLRNVREAQAAGYTFTHLLWHQGESDAVLGTSREDYERRFLGMLGAIRALGVDAPAFVALATRCGRYWPNETIRSAQMELVNPSLGIFAGPDTDQLDETYRYDGCHFSDAGLEAHAELWLSIIRNHIAQTEPTPTPTLAPTPTIVPTPTP